MAGAKIVVSVSVRKGHSKRFADAPPAAPEPVRRPARLAIMLGSELGAAAADSRGPRFGRRRSRGIRIGWLTFGSRDQSIFG